MICPSFCSSGIGKFLNFKMVVNNSETLLYKCAQFRDEEQFIDVRLKVGEDIFAAHRRRSSLNQ